MTEQETTELDQVIEDVVGVIPTEEEDVLPEEPEEEPTEETPSEPEPEPEAKPDSEAEAEPESEHELEAEQQDYTPREKALYARMKKYQERAKESEGKLTGIERDMAELRGRVEGIGQIQPQEEESELVNPLSELDPDDIPTAGQLLEFESYLDEKSRKQAQRQQAEQAQQAKRFLDAADEAGQAIYDDWAETIRPVLSKMGNDPQVMQQLFNAQHPARAARAAYEYAKKLSPPRQTTTTKPSKPAKPSGTESVTLDWEHLTPAQQESISNAISLCQTDEQIDELLKRLGMRSG